MSLKRTPIRKVSDKRAKEMRLYGTLRKEYMRQNPVCEVCHIKPATDLHHRAKRGANYLKVETWMSACRVCHDHIHRYPGEARRKGYLV